MPPLPPRALNKDWEKNCYSHHVSELKIIYQEKLLRLILSDSHSSTCTLSVLINGFWGKYATPSFKEKDRDEKNKKSGFHCSMDEVSAELSSTEDNPRENN